MACSWTGLVGVGTRTIYKPTTQTAILEIFDNEGILNYVFCAISTLLTELHLLAILGLYLWDNIVTGGKGPVVAEDCMAYMTRIFPGQMRVLITSLPQIPPPLPSAPPKALTVQKSSAFLSRKAKTMQTRTIEKQTRTVEKTAT